MKKIILYFVLFASFIGKANAQFSDFESMEVQSSDFLITEESPGTYSFNADAYLNNWNPSSNPVEFIYLWSFGDGQYSMEPHPVHSFASSNSSINEYQVVLYATPVYVPLGPPPALYIPSSESIVVNPGSNPIPLSSTYMTPASQNISLSYNRLPRGSYESTFIITYKNLSGVQAYLPLHFDFNDTYFEYKGIVAPDGEILADEVSSPLGSNYTTRLKFENTIPLEVGEERSIFIQMKSDPGLSEIEEGSPDLYINAGYTIGGDLFEEEVTVNAVSSWDPNNKITSVPYINLDEITFPQKVRYRINCENMGTGPTGSVTITETVSSLLDFSSFTYLADKDTLTDTNLVFDVANRRIEIEFPTLSLEGTNSSNLVSLDECRYWVDFEFDIDQTAFNNMFGSSAPCSVDDLIGVFGTNAEIVFDNHAPILTNVATTEVHCEVVLPPLEITNVFPNPVRDITNITYVVNSAITNPTGVQASLVEVATGNKHLLNVPLVFTTGTHQVTLDITDRDPGSYVFQIQVSGLTFTSSTIVKQ